MRLLGRLLPLVRLLGMMFVFAFTLTSDGVIADPLPKILHDIKSLPEPVQKMRSAILKAARSGDLQEMRYVLDTNEIKPLVSYGGDKDPLSFWKLTSQDGNGREILAILTEILTTRFVKIFDESKNEIYVWPYFAERPLENLSPVQEVELYRLVSPKDVKVMKEFGGYIHYRIGIGKDGTWHYFVAGD